MTELRLCLEGLESRWLLDGSAATLAPGASNFNVNGVAWNASQNTLTVDFNIPGLDEFF